MTILNDSTENSLRVEVFIVGALNRDGTRNITRNDEEIREDFRKALLNAGYVTKTCEIKEKP